mgnify:CR=1 FL=1
MFAEEKNKEELEKEKLEMLQELWDRSMGIGDDLDEDSDYDEVRERWEKMCEIISEAENSMDQDEDMSDEESDEDPLCEFDRENRKSEMLQELHEMGFGEELDENSDYEDVEEAWEEMQKALSDAEDDMFPNGRDMDAENFDD